MAKPRVCNIPIQILKIFGGSYGEKIETNHSGKQMEVFKP